MYIAVMATINLKVTDELRDQFKVYCATKRITMTEMLIECINTLLGDPPAKPVPKPKPAPDVFPELREEPAPPLTEVPFDNTQLTKGYSARKPRKR